MGFLRWKDDFSSRFRAIPTIVFSLIVVFSAYVRFSGLGERSLWGDEFCTWKVAQMPLGESLRWQPELTKPPLYQFVIRSVMSKLEGGNQGGEGGNRSPKFDTTEAGPRGVPSEWHLRLPAALSGVLAVAAMGWLGSLAGGWTLGAAAALLFAVNSLQIDYSQEARPYSMLVLGSLVSTGIWYRLMRRHEGKATEQGGEAGGEFRRWRISWWAIGYIFVAALTFHANYLMALTVIAHALWAVFLNPIANRQSPIDNFKAPAAVFVVTAIFCVPIVWHFLRHRTSVFQGLDWIPAPTISDAVNVLGQLTFGWIWVVGLLAPAIVCFFVLFLFQIANRKSQIENKPRAADRAGSKERDFPILLVTLLAVAWGGLWVISWLAHPAMVARYALPAAAPAILLPLIVLGRLDRRLPLLLAGLVAVGTSPTWATRADRVRPGFREMVQFLNDYADPEREAVVVAIERTTSPGWEEMDLLGFEYYQRHEGTEARRHERESRVIEVLYLRNRRPDGEQAILHDPRALWVVTFLADPMKAIAAAGRRIEQIEIADKVFEQLFFEPYRLIRVGAKKSVHIAE